MTSLKTEKSFEVLEIDEERILMVNAWDNYKEKTRVKEIMPEVDRVSRVLKSRNLKNYPNQLKSPTPHYV